MILYQYYSTYYRYGTLARCYKQCNDMPLRVYKAHIRGLVEMDQMHHT
jgi:hypothetical protein